MQQLVSTTSLDHLLPVPNAFFKQFQAVDPTKGSKGVLGIDGCALYFPLAGRLLSFACCWLFTHITLLLLVGSVETELSKVFQIWGTRLHLQLPLCFNTIGMLHTITVAYRCCGGCHAGSRRAQRAAFTSAPWSRS